MGHGRAIHAPIRLCDSHMSGMWQLNVAADLTIWSSFILLFCDSTVAGIIGYVLFVEPVG
jgi:hypothetical protein